MDALPDDGSFLRHLDGIGPANRYD